MIFSRINKYLSYILLSHSKKGHGIHSPFVFDLVSRVFRNKPDPDIVCKIERVRKNMLSDKRFIEVEDLGSGNSLNSNKRRVSAIARSSPVSPKYGRLLSNMASEFGKPFVIELGTSFGISAMYLAASNRETDIFTIEGSKEISAIADKNFVEGGFNNIRLIVGSFDEILSDFLIKGKAPGLVFIDGNHRREPLMKYFNMLADFSDNKTVVIIDDINYSGEMSEAWSEIKLHKKVSVSVDIFRMGIVFFREGINPNNYVIRY